MIDIGGFYSPDLQTDFLTLPDSSCPRFFRFFYLRARMVTRG